MNRAGPARTLLRTLLEEPTRFGFDAALAVLMRATGSARPGDAVRFHAAAGLGFVAAEVNAVERSGPQFRLTSGMLGLSGPSGVLPRSYTDAVNGEQRRHAPALAAFLDLLAQRPIAQFAGAAIKYRPHRAAQSAQAETAATAPETEPAPSDGLRQMALALTGYGTPHLAPRLLVGTEPMLFYAGLFAMRPRSADRLSAIVSDWLQQPVEVEQLAGSWLHLPAEERSALPKANRAGRFNRLGFDAMIGSRSWDLHSGIRLRIGPLSLDRFRALLPDRPLFLRLGVLVRAFLDCETGFSINPVLAADAVPPLGLRAAAPARLGWDSWLPTASARRRDATEAVFEGDGTAARGTAS